MANQSLLYSFILMLSLFIELGLAVEITEIYIGATPPFRDFIELMNPTDSAVDISDWLLTNDPNFATYYIFPLNTTIAPFDYYVIYSDEYGLDLQMIDTVYLMNSEGIEEADCTIWHKKVSTGAKWVPTLGLFSFSNPMKFPTPGEPNSYPYVGNLIISEVLFNECVYPQYVVFQSVISTILTIRNCSHQFQIQATKGTVPTRICLPDIDIPPYGSVILSTVASSTLRSTYKIPKNMMILYDSRLSIPNLATYPNIQSNYWIAVIFYWVEPYGFQVMDWFSYQKSSLYASLVPCQSIQRISPFGFAWDPHNWRAAQSFTFTRDISCSSNTSCPDIDECINSQCTHNTCSFNFNDNSPTCGYRPPGLHCLSSQILTQSSGYITDGSYEDYNNNVYCSWLIHPPEATKIFIKFYQFSSELNYDYLRIYDGPNEASPLLFEISGSGYDINPLLVTGFNTSQSAIFMTWSTNENTTDDGFSLYFSGISESLCKTANLCPQICSSVNQTIECSCTFGYHINEKDGSCIEYELGTNSVRGLQIQDFCGYTSPSPFRLLGSADAVPKASSYLGCFLDSPSHDLSSKSQSSPDMDLRTCSFICRDYSFFGVQNGSWCYCGNRYGVLGPAADCNVPCVGDPSETCGGLQSNSVWENPIQSLQSSDCGAYLTPSYFNNVGALWFLDLVNTLSNFTLSFSFEILSTDDRGEGFALVFAPLSISDLIGTPSASLGYDIGKVLAIEFDYRQNTELDDPDNPHISIQPGLPNHYLSYGWNDTKSFTKGIHTFILRYTSGLLELYLDDYDLVEPIVTAPYSFSEHFGPSMKVGFTAATTGVVSTPVIGWFTLDYICSQGYQPNTPKTACQDIDECATNTHNCDQICNNTIGGYTCLCYRGYHRTNNACNPKCGDSIAVPPEECDSGSGCSSNCQCGSGWTISVPLSVDCTDIDECSFPNIRKTCDHECINEPGTYECGCYTGYTLVNTTKCIPKPCVFGEWSSWGDCLKCSGSQKNRTRSIDIKESEGSPNCFSAKTIDFDFCSFPCQSFVIDALGAVEFLFREWSKDSFSYLNNQFIQHQIPITITDYSHLGTVISFIFHFNSGTQKRGADCTTNPMFGNITNLLSESIPNILLNVSASRIKLTPFNPNSSQSCGLEISIDPLDPPTPSFMFIIIGISAGVILLLLIIGYGLYYRSKIANIKKLPKPIRWSFRSAVSDVLHVKWKRHEQFGFLSKELLPTSFEFTRVREMFIALGGENLQVERMWAVYNSTLLNRFIYDYNNWLTRLTNDKNLFQKSTWKLDKEEETKKLREWIMERFNERVGIFGWNENSLVPIIPALHGTDLTTAFKICNGGFATLSSLDDGFFGRGVYMTTYAEYALRYAISSKPALILAYVMPGHPYPVVEDHRADFSLLGAALKKGCQSHYVRTKFDGFVVTEPLKDSFDEIVIGQETLVVPAFVLQISATEILKLKTQLDKMMAENEQKGNNIRRTTTRISTYQEESSQPLHLDTSDEEEYQVM